MPGALDRVPQVMDPVDVDVVPAAKGQRPDPPPEAAHRELGAAAAPFVVADVALPEMDDLAERAHAGKFAEQTFDERRSASP
ncbi:hypothetical protein GCM10010172_13340 [Paractinoplanes ferrugineus]|uniref:Uncharacterized protein n=1 Tax=Paractinoplanes ferrugineus TaxID=113564 RepID=A0A919IXC3_9ACTN|nr:hypothetical protein Afe05nite_17390 [Actinoplanes ferrugineus]